MLIAHISDLHVCLPGTLYQGLVDSNAMLANAVAAIGRLESRPDAVIISGDITEHGLSDEYAEARRMLANIGVPFVAIPGNHDERAAFRAGFGLLGTGPLHTMREDLGPVRIIGVDVTVPGLHHGEFDDAAEAWLAARLAAEPERPTLIMLHQPPFESGIGFIDAYRCMGGKRLEALVLRYPAVERVVCGHIHRMAQRRFGGTIALTAPSTATAIALRLDEGASPASWIEPPGMLLHHWREGTGMVSHFMPIGQFRGPLEFF
jgi:3',5'-cyclic-AMP phosphodiesterase